MRTFQLATSIPERYEPESARELLNVYGNGADPDFLSCECARNMFVSRSIYGHEWEYFRMSDIGWSESVGEPRSRNCPVYCLYLHARARAADGKKTDVPRSCQRQCGFFSANNPNSTAVVRSARLGIRRIESGIFLLCYRFAEFICILVDSSSLTERIPLLARAAAGRSPIRS